MPRIKDPRRAARSFPGARAWRTTREISSASIASSSASGSPSSRSWVCCAISSDQLTSWDSSVPPDSNRSPSGKSSGKGKARFQTVCFKIPSRTSCVRFNPGSS